MDADDEIEWMRCLRAAARGAWTGAATSLVFEFARQSRVNEGSEEPTRDRMWEVGQAGARDYEELCHALRHLFGAETVGLFRVAIEAADAAVVAQGMGGEITERLLQLRRLFADAEVE